MLNTFGIIKTMNSMSTNISLHLDEPWLGQTKNYEIGICFFSASHAALRKKSKDWLAQNQDIVS
jgi:hypothetical protein